METHAIQNERLIKNNYKQEPTINVLHESLTVKADSIGRDSIKNEEKIQKKKTGIFSRFSRTKEKNRTPKEELRHTLKDIRRRIGHMQTLCTGDTDIELGIATLNYYIAFIEGAKGTFSDNITTVNHDIANNYFKYNKEQKEAMFKALMDCYIPNQG